MSLYAEYIKEHRGDGIIEDECGFATYRFLNEGKSIYLIDIYVRPEYRNLDLASSMADMICEIGKKKGAKEFIGTVCPLASSATASLKVLLAYGMKLKCLSDGMIVFHKEIQ